MQFLEMEKCLICQEAAARIKKSLGLQRGKSDKVDSQRIAEYGMRYFNKLRLRKPKRQAVVSVKDLLVNLERIKLATNKFKVSINEVAKV
jgi:transposase